MGTNLNKSIAKLREDYRLGSLEKSAISNNPIAQFSKWFDEARHAELPEPNAMTLATCNAAGQPSARTVLLKGFDEKGFIFYTNYNSRKGKDLAANPKAALLFTWLELERQIRIEGNVEKLSEKDSTNYFKSRPKGSQIGAWASPQSKKIESREQLDQVAARLEEEYKNDENLPKPPHWGGFRLMPNVLEFWQGRSNRLHDRLLYEKVGDEWKISRLAP